MVQYVKIVYSLLIIIATVIFCLAYKLCMPRRKYNIHRVQYQLKCWALRKHLRRHYLKMKGDTPFTPENKGRPLYKLRMVPSHTAESRARWNYASPKQMRREKAKGHVQNGVCLWMKSSRDAGILWDSQGQKHSINGVTIPIWATRQVSI